MNAEQIFARFPTLETERLILRELKPDDAQALFGYLSDPQVVRHLHGEPLRTFDEARKMIAFLAAEFENRTGIRWGIVFKDTAGQAASAIIGTCGYSHWVPHHFRAEIGYELARPHWRKGLMTEAIQAALRFGFAQMGLNRVEATVAPDNAPSARLLEQLGFQSEGVLREYESAESPIQASEGQLPHGGFSDLAMYSLLRHAYLRR